jgi:large subunit ribosomal protein L15
MIDLSNLTPAPGSRKNPKRLGRGDASGTGGTSGKGHKGQKARSGASIPGWFEGGQMPIYRRLPKRGFKNPFRKEFIAVNIKDLSGFESGSVVDKAVLIKNGIIRKEGMVKLLSDGEINVVLTVKLDKASKAAIEKIEKAGGKFETL